jgi:hypothetical protein
MFEPEDLRVYCPRYTSILRLLPKVMSGSRSSQRIFMFVHVQLRDFLFRRTHGRTSTIQTTVPRLSSYPPRLPNLIAQVRPVQTAPRHCQA